MPKNSLSNKRKVDELSANETCDESDDAKLAMSQAGNEPLKKSRKMTTSKVRTTVIDWDETRLRSISTLAIESWKS